jgi:hypothetical protein
MGKRSAFNLGERGLYGSGREIEWVLKRRERESHWEFSVEDLVWPFSVTYH